MVPREANYFDADSKPASKYNPHQNNDIAVGKIILKQSHYITGTLPHNLRAYYITGDTTT